MVSRSGSAARSGAHRGCAFHFGAVCRLLVYKRPTLPMSISTELCRKTMAPAFLPAEVIPMAFAELEGANTDALVDQHLQYVRQTWVESTVWPPSAWSVYRQPVRTNDCEGWHYRLNAKAGHSRLNLYQMIQLLHAEATLVSINVRLLSEGSASRIQRTSYSRLHAQSPGKVLGRIC